ncbi:MAG: hypothetical protein RLW62_18970 [Gammaproteobacteria bacterium]
MNKPIAIKSSLIKPIAIKPIVMMLLCSLLGAAPGVGMAAPCADGSAAEAAVRAYLVAMQEHRFEDAYQQVTATMTDGKSQGEWAALQKLFYEGGEVNIFGIDIRAAQVPAGASDCAARAVVPNVLQSRDKFNNQGLTEFEIYTAVATADGWRIDAQQTLFEQDEVDQWFPGEKMPEFRDQY